MNYKIVKNNNGIHIIDGETHEPIAKMYKDDGLAEKIINTEFETMQRQALVLSAVLDYSTKIATVEQWAKDNEIKGPPTTKWRNFL